jgi:Papain-like cysteine protease AvrRpt2
MNNYPRPMLLTLFLLIHVTFGSAEVFARTDCGPTPQGIQCISQVDFNRFAQTAFHTQQQSQWCWAASISMLFSYYGHPVAQEKIVRSLYGTTVNLPSGTGWNIASRLNRDWMDDNNKPFKSRLTAAYDFDAGVMTLDNAWIVNELDQDRPFIIGTKGHAVVATAVRYQPTQFEPVILAIGVFDPWPGRGARWLDFAEMRAKHLPGGALQFLATVTVSN